MIASILKQEKEILNKDTNTYSMGKITFITGGARSGKSSFAERLLSSSDSVLYIATGIPFDDEMKERIAKHKERRNKNWQTIEAYKNIGEIINKNSSDIECILIDCITIMINNLMLLDNDIDWNSIPMEKAGKVENDIQIEIAAMLNAARDFKGTTIIVSNELGMGLVPIEPLGRHYRDIAGRANQMIAEEADEVYFLVSGIAMKVKEHQIPYPCPLPYPYPENTSTQLDHEKLNVYKIALNFSILTNEINNMLPDGFSHIKDQLFRASSSIALNIAEGAGEFSPGDKARFYRIAKRSATECASIFDICKIYNIIDENNFSSGKNMLLQISGMLTKMAKNRRQG